MTSLLSLWQSFSVTWPMLPRTHGMYSRLTHIHAHMVSVKRAQAVQPSASRAQLAARLLVELRALMRQRRGTALLGCCLHLIERFGACEQHLGTLPQVSSACMFE